MKKTKDPIDEDINEVQTTVPEDNSPETANSEDQADTAPNAAELALAEMTNDLQRTRADFENYRKQVEAQKSQAMSAAKMATVMKFLPFIDDLERALDTYSEQLTPLRKSFNKTLKELGLEKIASEPGIEFNPDFHEAISVEDGDGETEVIAETLRPGYLYDGNVLRAAMVKVTRQ